MSKDFLPAKDAELLSWKTDFSAAITATPTDYGLVAGQATAFAALLSAYSAALAIATNPMTRTRGSEKAQPFEFADLKQIDTDYYIHHQILPASLRILKVLGVDEKRLQ